MSSIVILLSTYNGERYLQGFVESIQKQSFVDWKLLVRDDGSNDHTLKLIRSLALEDKRIHLMGSHGNVGVVKSFSALSEEALQMFPKVNYFMFADQDDVWLDFKIIKTFEEMKKQERDDDLPVLVHTDLKVVTSGLDEISSSFMRYQQLRHERKQPLGVLLIQNFITGCTVMVNRRLLELAVPFSSAVIMHDWWLGQCAAAAGSIGFVNESTILYRQHENNTLGAIGFSKKVVKVLKRRFSLTKQERYKLNLQNLKDLIDQSNQLYRVLKQQETLVEEETLLMLEEFSDILYQNSSALLHKS
ncbi:glycosyltransferase family 2 protein [methane-oxidizing endosymbiont of Gigantopelta aegis]|uniref:glycosyltransferase family 2 protein n=1 Tax=methane-oxidizing endosymbiont of Gigantopelta aegis TaxID=2794938 RepID=UPI0018DE70C3|nr:glycosyltransferase family 2 protein [methane-oxidizing endosymbiont of Gigantopelta aegis]